MRRCGQETDVRGVPAVDVGMRHAAENAEVRAMLLEKTQVGGCDVVAPIAQGKELVAQKSQVVAHREHPARLGTWCERAFCLCRRNDSRQHRFQKRERECDAGPLEKTPPGKWTPGGDERSAGKRTGGVRRHRRAQRRQRGVPVNEAIDKGLNERKLGSMLGWTAVVSSAAYASDSALRDAVEPVRVVAALV
jgi:hypothetical protein